MHVQVIQLIGSGDDKVETTRDYWDKTDNGGVNG